MKGRSKRVPLISGEHVFVTQQPLCLSVGLKSALLFGQLAFAFLQNPLLASRVLQREGGYLEDECLEDAPGMEVRDLREQSEGSLDDPLFGTEEEGDLGELDPDMGEVSEEVSERPGALDISDESGLSDRTYGEDEGDEAGDNLNEDCDEGLQTDQQQASDNLESENFD